MIADKFVDLYARNSGLRDKLVAERDVVLTYALRTLIDEGVMDHLAFKGGTCLRKIVFGSSGRFSEDLDFSLASGLPNGPRFGTCTICSDLHRQSSMVSSYDASSSSNSGRCGTPSIPKRSSCGFVAVATTGRICSGWCVPASGSSQRP